MVPNTESPHTGSRGSIQDRQPAAGSSAVDAKRVDEGGLRTELIAPNAPYRVEADRLLIYELHP